MSYAPEHFLSTDRQEPNKQAVEERRHNMRELYAKYDAQRAQEQAARCLHCGNPYCQIACPTHNYIPNWLQAVAEGNFMLAAQLSHKTSSLPEICGRICPQDRLCEGACTLEDTHFGAVTIGAIEQFITDTAMAEGWKLAETIPVRDDAIRVAVIGAGPAGLSCADVLSRAGLRVDVYDRHPEIGGLLTFGIPAFKLDKSIVIRRRRLLQQQHVRFFLNVDVGTDIAFADIAAKYAAVFIGTGVYTPLGGDLSGETLPGVYKALPYLIANTKKIQGWSETNYINLQGKHVVVLGGGDTAMDCNRTAIRQGAASVTCVYRRDERNMPGSATEVRHAKEEGVQFAWQTQPTAIVANNDNSGIRGVAVVQTTLGPPDEGGRQKPTIVSGSERCIDADAVIIAFGFRPSPANWFADNAVFTGADGRIQLSDGDFAMQTNNDRIFAGGDAVRGASLVVEAMVDGRRAAEAMLDYLGVA